jgi:hypothetical protein
MGLLAEIFESEFETIEEELKEQLHDIVIEQTALELINRGLVKYPEELKIFLEYVSDYIYGVLKNEQILNEDDAYQKLPLLLSISSGIIDAVQFLENTGVLSNINWKKVAKYGAGLALAGLGGIAAASAVGDAKLKAKEAEEDEKTNTKLANEKLKKEQAKEQESKPSTLPSVVSQAAKNIGNYYGSYDIQTQYANYWTDKKNVNDISAKLENLYNNIKELPLISYLLRNFPREAQLTNVDNNTSNNQTRTGNSTLSTNNIALPKPKTEVIKDYDPRTKSILQQIKNFGQ